MSNFSLERSKKTYSQAQQAPVAVVEEDVSQSAPRDNKSLSFVAEKNNSDVNRDVPSLRTYQVTTPRDQTEYLLEQARKLVDANIPTQAIAIGEKILSEKPDHLEANRLMAQVLSHMGRRAEAIEYLQRALSQDPEALDLCKQLAQLLMEDCDWHAARHALNKLIRLHPHDVLAVCRLAQCQRMIGDVRQAYTTINRVMDNLMPGSPDYPMCAVERARIMLQIAATAKPQGSYEHGYARDYASFSQQDQSSQQQSAQSDQLDMQDMQDMQGMQGVQDQGEGVAFNSDDPFHNDDPAQSADPDQNTQERDSFDDKTLTIDRVLSYIAEEKQRFPLNVDLAVAQSEALVFSRDLNAAQKSLSDFSRHSSLSDSDRKVAQYHLAMLQQNLGLFDSAHLQYRRSIDPDHPNAQYVYGCAQSMLRFGKYHEGWALYEARTVCGVSRAAPPFAGVRRWLGQPLRGETIIVVAEQSYADIIRFSRFLLALRAQGAHVIFQVPPALVRLFSVAKIADMVVGYGDPLPQSVMRDARWYELLGSLPLRLGCVTADHLGLPNAKPYLHKASDIPPISLRKDQGVVHIGLLWNSDDIDIANEGVCGYDHEEMVSDHCVPTRLIHQHLSDLLPHPLYMLQQKSPKQMIKQLDKEERFFDLSDYCGDPLALAHMLKQLDVVVAVDGMVAHLAGAMGVKTWVMLSANSHWSWGLGEGTSPWYPHVTLIRQKYPMDWSHVLTDVGQRLRSFYRGSAGVYLDQTRTAMNDAYTRGDFATAKKALSVVLRSNPQDIHVNHMDAVLACKDGRYQSANEAFMRTIDLVIKSHAPTQDVLTVARNAVLCAERANSIEHLLSVVDTLSASDFFFEEVFLKGMKLAKTYQNRAQLVSSVKVVAPDNIHVIHAQGCLHLERGEYNTAINVLRTAYQSAPDDISIHNDLGLALKMAKNYTEARSILEAAHARSPKHLNIARNLGQLLAEHKQESKAIEVLQTAIFPLPEPATEQHAMIIMEPALELCTLLISSHHYDAAVMLCQWLYSVVPYSERIQELHATLGKLGRL